VKPSRDQERPAPERREGTRRGAGWAPGLLIALATGATACRAAEPPAPPTVVPAPTPSPSPTAAVFPTDIPHAAATFLPAPTALPTATAPPLPSLVPLPPWEPTVGPGPAPTPAPTDVVPVPTHPPLRSL